jgi:hypothetical protein
MLKTKTERLLALAVAFLAGCEASHAARSAIATAHADEAPAGMQQWDYACVSPDPENVQVEANRLGKRGWELVAASPVGSGPGSIESKWCFKRPRGASAQ